MKRLVPFAPLPLALLVYAACGGSTGGGSPASTADAGDAQSSTADGAPDVATCDAPKRFCNTVCVDTQTDPNHCGKCGNACSLGACTNGACANVSAFAMSKVFMGDTDRAGVANANAWKDFGANLDGIVSTATANGECQLQAGAASSARADGTNGIDNSFGKNILPVLASVAGASFTQQTNDALTASYFDYLIRVNGLDASNDIPSLTSALYATGQLTSPKYDGTDRFPVLFESVTSSDLEKPKLSWQNAHMTARVFDSGDSNGDGVFVLSFGLDSITVPMRKVRITMRVAADGSSATEGNLGGVIPTDAFVAEFRKLAGRFSQSLCAGGALDAIVQQLRQASDIMQDGSQDPQKTCDGISFGIGFDAKRDGVGAVLSPALPPVDVCE